ncbi:endonuclease/exonuclease/phosphatase family protein [Polaromonas glacialis]|uniref:endonuclease/exonuclease/phosphatase family protein n=1 Tax=Polaromonas glacialis TaxID=866564 RepID=UPI00068F2DE9|nr:endonuclease/exonuclease/phosphatase family protein [Polaromonas glacialis]
MILHWLVALTAGLAILSTLLPLLRCDAWWVRIFEFPRVQITVVSLVTLLAYGAIGNAWQATDWLLWVGLAACTVFQTIRIAPYTPLFPKQIHTAPQPAEKDTLHVIVSNVLMSNRKAEALLRLVRQRKPDLLLTVESDRWWEQQLNTLEADYPHSVKCPLDNLYGMHLYSRLPLVDPELHFLVEDDVPSIHAKVRLPSGRLVSLHCVHPAPPSPTENATSAERDGELLLVAKSLDKPARSVVVMGDLNDVAWSASTRMFQHLSGLLDPRVGRGTFNTFHARYPFLRWPLDHVFCSPDFTLVTMARLPNIGSDHFPIEAVLQRDPHAVALHDEPQADAEEREIADEKIDKVDADRQAL